MRRDIDDNKANVDDTADVDANGELKNDLEGKRNSDECTTWRPNFGEAGRVRQVGDD